MKKAVKIIGVLFCFMLVIVLSECNSGIKLRGVYTGVDKPNNSLHFISGSKVTFDLDGEKNEGTYKITESMSLKQITITVKGSPRYIIFNIIDENTLNQANSFYMFKKEIK